jgi:AraC-like DNA-binding protein
MSRDDIFLQTIKTFIEKNYKESELNVEALAKESHLSYIQFYRKFKALTGVNAKEYIRTFRLKKAAHILENNSSKSVGEVMYSVGFSSQSYFTNAFKKEYGITPNQYKKKFN